MKQSQSTGTKESGPEQKNHPGGTPVRSPDSTLKDHNLVPVVQKPTSGAEPGLKPDDSGAPQQDTPGKAKSASSRQQTVAGQVTLTGSEELDRESAEGDSN